MKYKVTINYQEFIFSDRNTADTFAAIAKEHIYSADGKKDTVTNEYLTDEEAAEYEKGN